MKAKTAQNWQKLGCYSLAAALPVMSDSALPEARADGVSVAASSVAGRRSKPAARLDGIFGGSALLKRQSAFRLPHQRGGLDLLLGGADDCPGRPVPGGSYTAAVPYTDSGDTTGANDTVSRAHFIDYHYYFFDSLGPDHIYTFTLTGRGPNSEIRVSATSPNYAPLVYVLHGGVASPCPAGTGNQVFNYVLSAGSSPGGSATFESAAMNFLPLNVPLHLFVDGNGTNDVGSYTIRMQDVTVTSGACPNPIDCAEFFVRQHYADFLGREPDLAGLTFWTNGMTSCGGDAQCGEVRRVDASAAFFLSIEHQETGYLTHRAYKVAYGNLPNKPVPLTLQEYLAGARRIGDGVQVGVGDWRQRLEANKTAFFNEFLNTPRFTALYPPGSDNGTFVATLNQNAGGALSEAERDALVAALNGGTMTRAQAVRAVAEDADFAQGPERNRAFVLAQYFGYLRRNPDDVDFQGNPDPGFLGYHFWLAKLDQFGGDYVAAEMVKAFLTSIEYRRRFGNT